MKLDLGCGRNKKEGFYGIDCNPDMMPDKVWDLENGLPFLEDNSVDEVYASHILEHIHGLIPFMIELYRVCKNGTKIHIKVPKAPHPYAFRDPIHVRFFTDETFWYFHKGHILEQNYNFPFNFRVVKNRLSDGRDWELDTVLEVVK